jgi:hypothetical protein
MGQPEVLGVLIVQRSTGDDSYYTKAEIHRLMLRHGISNSPPSISYSVNGLYTGGFLEVKVEGDILHRQLLFRAKLGPSRIQTSCMKNEYNTPRSKGKNRSAPTQGTAFDRARHGLEARHG